MLNKKANLLSKPDAYYNIENFGTGTGKQNVLYVSGYSGGGKSTVGKQIAEQHGASYIELDALHTMKDSDKKHKIVEQYFKENPHLVKDGKGISGIDYNYKSQQFLPYLRDYVKKHPNEKFVVEGIQTLNSKDPNVPRVVKGTGLLESTRRAAARNAAQGRKGDVPLALNAYLYPQINKERKFIQNTIRNTDYAQGRLGRAQKIMDSSVKAAKKAGVTGLALAGAATIANNEINKRVKRKGENKMRKEAFERLDEAFEKINVTGMSPVEKTALQMLDESIEKIAERDNENVTKGIGGASLIGAGGAGLYYANKDREASEAAIKKAKKYSKKSTGQAVKAGLAAGIGAGSYGLAYKNRRGDEVERAVLKGLGNLNTAAAGVNLGALSVNKGKSKAQKELAERTLRNAKLKGAAGIAGLGLGAGTLLAANKKKD